MMGFAAMLERLPREPLAFDDWAAGAAPDDVGQAQALLAGRRPRRVVGLTALLDWAAEVAGVPDWLVASSLAVSGDMAEVAALVLPAPLGPVPGLAEVVGRLECCTPISAHGVMVALWARMPPPSAVWVNRLASGTFRVKRAEVAVVGTGPKLSLRAVMVQAQAGRAEVTLALWAGNALVPVARLPLELELAETGEIMGWIRANVAERFGPVRMVPPVQLFDVEFHGLARNARRKCGFDLVGARITAWVPDQGAQADKVEILGVLAAGRA